MTETDYQALIGVIEPLAEEWLADNPLVSDEAVVSLLAQSLQETLTSRHETATTAEAVKNHALRHLRQMYVDMSKEEAQRGSAIILSAVALLVFSVGDYRTTDLANELFYRAATLGTEDYQRNHRKIMAKLQANDRQQREFMHNICQDLTTLNQLPEGRELCTPASAKALNCKHNYTFEKGSNPVILSEPNFDRQAQ